MLNVYSDVLVRPVTLMQPLVDVTVCEGDIAQLEVKFSQENVEGTWMKDRQPVKASDRVHIVIDKQIHKLLIEDTNKDDMGMYSFEVPAQEISTSGKLVIQSKNPNPIFQRIKYFKTKCSKQQILSFVVYSNQYFDATKGQKRRGGNQGCVGDQDGRPSRMLEPGN